ncbi:F-box/kelch-repeat protein At4g38940 [Eutrema salsugineum]|uniref:F-box/kelch-repeat protein At4g38940 n=1 Tax=Eutrema salsugineum TaxID=72664 RepID=UPI000CECEA70|nr:F-box/kelch-repeat protein At4g38940 [Eutrema salsugineum]
MSSKISAKKTRSSSLITLLPEDIIIDILARVPRCNYPTLSLVSKHFRSIVESSEIYARRSLLDCTEHCLYVVLYDTETDEDRWYILRQIGNGSRRLLLLSLLPAMRYCKSFVAVGPRIYMFGWDQKNMSLSIDCRSHTVQTLASMPVPLYNTIAGIIDGRIYVIGIYESKVMLVFNTETQMWEHEIIKIDTELRAMWNMWSYGCVVMADKLYARDDKNSFIYDPKKIKWEMDHMLNSKAWVNACVVDDVLYYHDTDENEIKAYDPKQKCWSVVKEHYLARFVVRRFLWKKPKEERFGEIGDIENWMKTVEFHCKKITAAIRSIHEDD